MEHNSFSTDGLKFIGSGSARRVYGIDDGKVLKTFIPERKSAGIEQNKIEYSILDQYSSVYTCFPKVYDRSEDYGSIVVEKCRPIDDGYLTRLFSDVIDITSISIAERRLDPYKHIPIDNNFCRWFAFCYGYLIGSVCSRIDSDEFESTFPESTPAVMSLNAIIEKKELSLSSPEYQLYVDARNFTEYLSNHLDDPKARSIADIIDFYIKAGRKNGFMFAELWNATQWGMSLDESRITLLDVGYSHALSDSRHYRRLRIEPLSDSIVRTYPRTFPNRFNGMELDAITSPSGSRIMSKFYTKSEYIISEDGQSRHIKNLGMQDDGLWEWSDKTIFVPRDSLFKFMDEMKSRNFLKACKVDFHRDNSLTCSVYDENGDWKVFATLEDVRAKPEIGLHVCEFYLDEYENGHGILKSYHPGHDVMHIDVPEAC